MGENAAEIELRKQCRPMWCVWRTTKQMCHDRRYLVLHSELNLSLDEFLEMWRDLPSIDRYSYAVQHLDNPTDQLMVFFSPEKVNSDLAEEYFRRLRENNIQSVIIVLFNGIASNAKRTLAKITDVKVQYFSKLELMINITRHSLVPHHVVLTEEEKQALLDRYKTSDDNLPCMQEEDPISRYYGLKPGQVVKITRRSETAGRYVTYRIVIPSIID